MNQLIKFALVATLLMTTALPATSAVQQENIIQGFAQWNASRIEKIILETGLVKIANDDYVKSFFPDTAASVAYDVDSGGRALAFVVEQAMKKDLDRLEFLVGACITDRLNRIFAQSDPKSITKDVQILYESLKGLSSRDGKDVLKWDKTQGEDDDTKKVNNVNDFSGFVCDEIIYSSAWEPVKPNDEIKEKVKRFGLWFATQKAFEKSELRVFVGIENIDGKKESRLSAMITLFTDVYEKVNTLRNNSESAAEPYFKQVNQILTIIDTYLGAGKSDYSGFKKLKRHSLMLASLADASAEGADQVESILRQWVNEEDVYNDKRSNVAYWSIFDRIDPFTKEKKTYTAKCAWYGLPCRDTVFISSFWGLAYSRDFGDDDVGSDPSYGYRPFGPLGVEWKLFSFHGKALSLNYAPLDLGVYIQNELLDETDTASLSDINSPSVFMSLSMKSYPVAWLIGHQWDVKSHRGEENSAFIAVTFDLPVFTLW